MFIDVDTIDPGADFAQRIREALDTCELALILIGPRWLTLTLADGTRRLDAKDDYVRQEVAAALGRSDVTVVPVLIEGAKMPSASELPEEIASLAKFNAFDLSTKRWQYDIEQLTRFARRYDDWWWRMARRVPRLAVAALLIAAATAGAVAVALGSRGGGPDRAARVASCERTHAMSGAQEARAPRPGETQIQRSQLVQYFGSSLEFTQTTYASCSWPVPTGGDPDGYRAITVTTTNGPGKDDASGRDFEDLIESPCERVELHYQEEFMGDETPWRPFAAARGDIWAPANAPTESFARVAVIGGATQAALQLQFYPPAETVVVLHGQQVLQKVQCLG